ncbi:unnamed protein product, partial [Allacma fusca]
GIFKEAQLPVPEYLTTFIPIPKPNHPGGLTNHMSMVPFKCPIKASSAAERTQKIQEKSITMGIPSAVSTQNLKCQEIQLEQAYQCLA